MKCCASPLQRWPTLCSVDTQAPGLGFKDHSPNLKTHFDFSVISSSMCGFWDSHFSHHWAQNYNVCVGLSKDRTCAEMEEGMKAGSKGFSGSTHFGPINKTVCWMLSILILRSTDGIFLCSPLSLPVPNRHINSGDQTQDDTLQDSFCAGSGNRSTYFGVRRQSPSFVLHHLISHWMMWPQHLSVQ